MEISINTRQVTYSFAASKAAKARESNFGELLPDETVNSVDKSSELAEIIGEKSVPDKWTDEAGAAAARSTFNSVIEFLKNEGVDASSREPSHTLTDEQREWLNSRYDFSAMQVRTQYTETDKFGSTVHYTERTAEYNNFLADLLYLNVFSLDELCTIVMKPVPFDGPRLDAVSLSGNSGGIFSAVTNSLGMSDNSLLGDINRTVLQYRTLYNFFSDRARDPLNARTDDEKIAGLLSESMSMFEYFFEIVSDLTGGVEELKDDFDNDYLSADPVDKSVELAGIIGAQNAPKRWTSSSLYKTDLDTPEGYRTDRNAIKRVRDQLISEGIDPDKRTPTHELTAEQEEWLRSRYDVDFLKACSFEHPEFGNFMLDLAYLNVFSLDELETMYGVLPFNANHKAYIYRNGDYSGGGDRGYIDTVNGTSGLLSDEDLIAELIMEYIRAKYTGLSGTEYKRMADEMQAQRKERLTKLADFLARLSGNDEQPDNNDNYGGVRPVVRNISYKLKEDFGGIL